MNVFSALRFPLQVAGTVFDTLIAAQAVNRHAQSLAAMWEPKQDWEVALTDLKAEIESFEPGAPYLQWGGPETWPHPPYCNRCGYPHPTTQTCLRDATAEDWVRGTAEACGVDPERCVSRLSFEDAESSAVPPAAERPAGVVADPPSAPPAGHPHVEAFVPEEDRIATSTLLREAANYIDAVFPVCDSKYVGRLTTNLRKRSAAFAAVENTT